MPQVNVYVSEGVVADERVRGGACKCPCVVSEGVVAVMRE